jgi:hypothetical protein
MLFTSRWTRPSLVDVETDVEQAALLAVDVGDGGLSGDDVLEALAGIALLSP